MRIRLHCGIAVMLGLAVTGPARAAPPAGWLIAGSAPANYAFAVDTATPVKGSKSASITAKPTAASNGFATLMQMIAADDYRGSRLRLSGYLRTADADRSQMWMRVDGPNHQVQAFDNMDSRPVTGTTGWKRYDIVLDVPQTSVDVAFGFFLAGSGKVWGADFQLDKVGTAVPVTSQEPILPRNPTNLNFEMAAQTNAHARPSASLPVIPAGKGRLFIYEPETTRGGPSPPTEIRLNDNLVGTAVPDRFFLVDLPPGNYIVDAIHPETFGAGSFSGRELVQESPALEHKLTFHLNRGQVRYVRLDIWGGNPMFMAQIYPKLVDVAVGQPQIDKIESNSSR